MASNALTAWQTTASRRLDQLEQVHVQATGAGPGRRWQTSQLNRSLMVALVAQFQGFCRDLHDDAVKVHVTAATPGQRSLLQILLTQGRKLGTGNPRKSTLGSDFGRLGFDFIPAVEAADAAAAAQLDELDRLVDFRNAIVHGNESTIGTIEAAGNIRATKQKFRQNRKSLKALAATMDSVVADRLASLLSISAPW